MLVFKTLGGNAFYTPLYSHIDFIPSSKGVKSITTERFNNKLIIKT